MLVKVLSWNIWVNSYYEKVQDFLNKSDATVICLQEVSGTDSSRDTVSLLTNLGYNHVFYPQLRPWADNNRTDGPAIFTRYDIVQSKKFLLSEENGVGAVQADIDINGKIIHVFSTHLSHTHQKDSDLQLEQLNKLLPHIPLEHSVLMGDFNAIPSSNTIQLVKKNLICTDIENMPTWSVYPKGCEVCMPKKIETKLDYIFTSKDLQSSSFKVENSKGSDHLPISAVIHIESSV